MRLLRFFWMAVCSVWTALVLSKQLAIEEDLKMRALVNLFGFHRFSVGGTIPGMGEDEQAFLLMEGVTMNDDDGFKKGLEVLLDGVVDFREFYRKTSDTDMEEAKLLAQGIYEWCRDNGPSPSLAVVAIATALEAAIIDTIRKV